MPKKLSIVKVKMLFRPNAIGTKFVAPKMELFLLIYSTTFDAGKSYRRGTSV
jgi:hypothetical protein